MLDCLNEFGREPLARNVEHGFGRVVRVGVVADRLIQMGASVIVCDPHRVVISGKTKLHPQHMSSPDIRAGMALLMAALCAEGESVVDNAWIIDRGYENMTDKLIALGADIERCE